MDYIVQTLSGLSVVGMTWGFSLLLKRFTPYQVVIVKKKNWEAFKKVVPKLHAIMMEEKD